jgi:hypothetical protein
VHTTSFQKANCNTDAAARAAERESETCDADATESDASYACTVERITGPAAGSEHQDTGQLSIRAGVSISRRCEIVAERKPATGGAAKQQHERGAAP